MSSSTSLRVVAALAVALPLAAVFARLGIWQTTRLAERQAYNVLLEARLADTIAPFASLPLDTVAGHYRRVKVSGVYAYDHEVAWAPRMRRGSPGVNFLTPLRVAGSGTVLMVNRGWAYSPDARSAEFPRWRESDSANVAGYVETWTQECGDSAGAPLPGTCGDSSARALRRLDRSAVERLVGMPVYPYLLMQTSDSALHADSIPARVGQPVLDEGPHRGYAFQWFAFAVIALVGGSALAIREHRHAR